MRLLILTPQSAMSEHLFNQITQNSNNAPIELFNTPAELSRHLRRPICDPVLAVLQPKNNNELSLLIQMGHLLRDIRIILILPNQAPDTISAGHLLRPRYISYSDNDLSDVVAVVHKMMDMEKAYLKQAV